MVHFLKYGFFCILISGCAKESTQVGVLVKVIDNSKALEQAMIYVEDGTTSNPSVELSTYKRKYGADAIGEAYLTLPFNDYYIVARGYSPSLKKYVTGSAALRLNKNDQSDPQKIIIYTN